MSKTNRRGSSQGRKPGGRVEPKAKAKPKPIDPKPRGQGQPNEAEPR